MNRVIISGMAFLFLFTAPGYTQKNLFLGLCGNYADAGSYENWHYNGATSYKYDLNWGGGLYLRQCLSDRISVSLEGNLIMEKELWKGNRGTSGSVIRIDSQKSAPLRLASLNIQWQINRSRSAQVYLMAGPGIFNKGGKFLLRAGIGGRLALAKNNSHFLNAGLCFHQDLSSKEKDPVNFTMLFIGVESGFFSPQD